MGIILIMRVLLWSSLLFSRIFENASSVGSDGVGLVTLLTDGQKHQTGNDAAFSVCGRGGSKCNSVQA